MAAEPAFVRLLRETLEEELPEGIAAAVLFRALADWGARVPSSFGEVLQLVDGPLAAALAERLGAARADALRGALERRLRLAERPTDTVAAPEPWRFDEATTRALPKLGRAVGLRVASGTPTLAALVAASLGPDRVRGASAGETDALFLVDATDPPDWSEAEVLAAAGRAALTLLWGADTDAGRRLAARLAREGVEHLGFDTAHGVEPLLDVVRSRAG
jgi:hypothetical protein